MKKTIILLLSVVIGMAAFWLSGKYLKNERDKLYRDASKVEVIVASKDLPAWTLVEMSDLASTEVFASSVGENVFRPGEQNKLIGRRLKYSLGRGDPIMWSYIEGSEDGRRGLSGVVQKKMRAVSLPIAGAAGVSGLVQPNDRVDILGTFSFPSQADPSVVETVTLTLLQDVTVLAAGQRVAKDELWRERQTSSSGYSTLTFEVSPREAEVLVFAQQARGQLYLTLRNPDDIYYESDLPDVDFKHIENKLEDLNLYRQKNIRHKEI